jgi:hypothetical protein
MRTKVSLPILAVSFLASSAAGQGFWSNCTQYTLGWDKETVYRRIMVAQCTDGGGKQRYSFLPLDDCVTNAEGSMLPKKRCVLPLTCIPSASPSRAGTGGEEKGEIHLRGLSAEELVRQWHGD